MSFLEVRNAVHTHFTTAWNKTTPLFYDNQAVDPSKLTEFARISIRHAESQQASMAGQPTTRTVGVVIVQLFVKPGIGTKRLDELTDKAINAFQYVALRGDDWSIQFRAGYPADLGQPNGQQFVQVNVITDYFIDRR
jgi:hypothetical protein